jgi:hypothetical protein
MDHSSHDEAAEGIIGEEAKMPGKRSQLWRSVRGGHEIHMVCDPH